MVYRSISKLLVWEFCIYILEIRWCIFLFYWYKQLILFNYNSLISAVRGVKPPNLGKADKSIWNGFEQRFSMSCRYAVKFMGVFHRQCWSETTTAERCGFLFIRIEYLALNKF